MFTIKPLIRKNPVAFKVKPLARKTRASVIASFLAEGKTYQQAIRAYDSKVRQNAK